MLGRSRWVRPKRMAAAGALYRRPELVRLAGRELLPFLKCLMAVFLPSFHHVS